MKAIIRVNVPDWQIGQEVSLYFPDTMTIKGTCEKEKTGTWLTQSEFCDKMGIRPSGLIDFFWCSECNRPSNFKSQYCPDCGTKMEKKSDV